MEQQAIHVVETVAGKVVFEPGAMRLSAGYAEPFEVTVLKPGGQLYVGLADGKVLAIAPGCSLKSVPRAPLTLGVYLGDAAFPVRRFDCAWILAIGCELEAVQAEAAHILGTRAFH